MSDTITSIEQRISTLEAHLEHENPLLLDVVRSFRELDQIAYRLGVLSRDESFTTQVPWWPMVAVLGTFSSGKSSFINYFLKAKLQSTGNQAVDDKFTVVCYGADETPRTLPGLALDADPRFPFYQISRDIESVSAGEGRRIDAYLQLKACRSEPLRGKIIIDSPGFDADAQRNATLRITDHIIDLSDLVLVFFDARHPEPGAMQDTLRHLVGNTIHRPDSSKFLYILNQIDNAAREDNPEEVFAAWQRALAQGPASPRAASTMSTIPTPPCRLTTTTCGADSRPSATRISPRSTGAFTRSRSNACIASSACSKRPRRRSSIVSCRRLHPRRKRGGARWHGAMPRCSDCWSRGWRRGPSRRDTGRGSSSPLRGWRRSRRVPGSWPPSRRSRSPAAVTCTTSCASSRRGSSHAVSLDARTWTACANGYPARSLHNTRPWRTIVTPAPAGWGRGARRRIEQVVADADRFVQHLNNRFTDPSGETEAVTAETRPRFLESMEDTEISRLEPDPVTSGAERA